jgi:hypothetical protein
MQNVDGDYDEIVEWLDTNPGIGVEFYLSHGMPADAQGFYLNVGLFSLNEDHLDNCQMCTYGTGGYTCQFDRTKVAVATEGFTEAWRIEDNYTTHLIRF